MNRKFSKLLVTFLVLLGLLAGSMDASAYYRRGYGYYHRGYGYHRAGYYPVGYYGNGYNCRIVGGHYNRAGFWIAAHRVCW